MLKADKLAELSRVDPDLDKYYDLQPNGFYKVHPLDAEQQKLLRNKFLQIGFDALQFTDSRNVFQFYPLRRLYHDIEQALAWDIRLLHTATEPVSASEIYEALTHQNFTNEILETPLFYNYKSIYAERFGGHDGYLCDKASILKEICEFVSDFVPPVGI